MIGLSDSSSSHLTGGELSGRHRVGKITSYVIPRNHYPDLRYYHQNST